MKRVSRILPLFPLLGLALALTACGGGSSSSSTSPLDIQVAVSPSTLNIPTGGTEQFISAVSNTPTTGVNWTVSGTGDVGTISSNGLYTAPQAIPAPATVTVTATSQADTTKSASATISIVATGKGYSNASLKGTYVFSFNDVDTNNYFSYGGGVLTADGNGNITSGNEDRSQGGIGFQANIQFTGSYNIQADGTGTANLSLANGVLQLKFVMLADGSARFIDYSSNLTGGGTIEPQTATALTATSLAGTYVFSLHGDDAAGSGSVAQAGLLTLDGSGNITGTEDSNDNGTVNSSVNLTGTYTLGSFGRGTAQITTPQGTSNYVFYIVNANQVSLFESDFPLPATYGMALRQTVSSFSTSTFNGGYVFTTTSLATSTATSPAYIDAAGQFATDGNGNVSSGALDQNNLGTASSSTSINGTYSVTSNGRALINLNGGPNPIQLAVYFADATHGLAVGLNSSLVTWGEVFAQSGGPFSLTSLKGSYGVRLDGFNVSSAGNTQPYALSLQMSVDGAGNATGREDISNNGTLSPATGQVALGTFTMSSNGRGTLALNDASGASQFAVYMISPSRFVLVGVDNFQLLQGPGQIQ